jgi:hypothetical protein
VVILDEPNSNLDAQGEQALVLAIKDLRERGRSAIVMAHRPSAIQACDVLLMLDRGQPRAYGPKEEVLRQTTANHAQLAGARQGRQAQQGGPPADGRGAERGGGSHGVSRRRICRSGIMSDQTTALPGRAQLRLGGPAAPPTPDKKWSAKAQMRFGLAVVFVLVFGLGAWAAFASIAGAVVAPGRLKVETERQVVQHLDGGIVKEMVVEEGDVVEAGDVLMRLDDTRLDAELAIIESQLFEVLARIGRLEAEVADEPAPVFDDELLAAAEENDDVARLVAGQSILFEARARPATARPSSCASARPRSARRSAAPSPSVRASTASSASSRRSWSTSAACSTAASPRPAACCRWSARRRGWRARSAR